MRVGLGASVLSTTSGAPENCFNIGSGRPPGSHGKNKTLRDRVEEISTQLPVVIQPKRLVDTDDKDAAAQADHLMQFAGREMRKAQALLAGPPKDSPVGVLRDEFMMWANLVLRTASILLPYQRPTYRSIEVRTDRGLEERQTRYIGDPAERLAQIVVGAILAQPDAVVPTTRPQDAPADAVITDSGPESGAGGRETGRAPA
jgi:hypothetical protein